MYRRGRRSFKSPGGFKSPMLNRAAESGRRPSSAQELGQRISQLELTEKNLDQQIALLTAEGCRVEELDEHIAKLHQYNDIKDVAQMILGRLAFIDGVTSKQMHLKYNLSLDE